MTTIDSVRRPAGPADAAGSYTCWLEDVGAQDVERVGGKNASLGEMIRELESEGIRVPGGFATTAAAYWYLLDASNLRGRVAEHIERYRQNEQSLEYTGDAIRELIRNAPLPEDLEREIRARYEELCRREGRDELSVAVRSSATAEDLPDASFAGQQETFLNIRGADEVIQAAKECYASLFTDRAIYYREERDFDHMEVALSIGVQRMVRAGTGSSGVMFSIDPESGFPHAVIINGAWGLGELVVQGTVTPDEFIVFKPALDSAPRPILYKRCGTKNKKMTFSSGSDEPVKVLDTTDEERTSFVLNDDEILQLARWAVTIERHYGCPMDMEWAKDGETGELFIVQARPETVQSGRDASALTRFVLNEHGEVIVTGLSVGEAIGAGRARVLESVDDATDFQDGDVLVTSLTTPDWVPIMKKASAIVTEEGGRTSHAAIVSRELGVPAVVGAVRATELITDGQDITVSCAEGATGTVYKGLLDFEEEEVSLDDLPEVATDIYINIASPDAAFRWWRLPVRGIGLARMEFIINNTIKVHPLALLHLDEISGPEREEIDRLIAGYSDPAEYFVQELAYGISRIAASQHPHPVIVRMSDFKTNEYADLIGGHGFEPHEENPMLGWRGASRYYQEPYREAFALECAAIRRVREDIGLTNVIVMIPFCRTLEEADRVLEVMAEYGLERGKDGLKIFLMCELPANVMLAREFAERFDGFSIGSNDLTQLVLGIDRDSSKLRDQFDERDPAVKRMVSMAIEGAHDRNAKVGICGQAPSDHADFAAFLVEEGIDSISVNPDSVIEVIKSVAGAEARKASS